MLLKFEHFFFLFFSGFFFFFFVNADTHKVTSYSISVYIWHACLQTQLNWPLFFFLLSWLINSWSPKGMGKPSHILSQITFQKICEVFCQMSNLYFFKPLCIWRKYLICLFLNTLPLTHQNILSEKTIIQTAYILLFQLICL